MGGTYARFEDPDGNAFGLEGFDEVRQSLELRRQAHAVKLDPTPHRPGTGVGTAGAGAVVSADSAGDETVEYAGICLQARQVGGDYFDFLNIDRRGSS